MWKWLKSWFTKKEVPPTRLEMARAYVERKLALDPSTLQMSSSQIEKERQQWIALYLKE